MTINSGSPGATESMPQYRVTIRHGAARHRYAMLDVEADGLRAALRAAAEQLPPEAAEGDLVEIRRQTTPEDREYVPE